MKKNDLKCIRCPCNLFNPLTPRSDHYINSSNHFNTLSSKQVMKILENYQLGGVDWI